ncbi:hypothetical protein OQA88_10280 [Cercophora sp. LCS_1]
MTKAAQATTVVPRTDELTGPKPIAKPRRKTKTGCRTCKIRRVKCDEGKPACQRCVSTGRVCDGYGIWGGGGNAYGSDERSFHRAHQVPQPTRPLAVMPSLNKQESQAFDFFRTRTALKIPGVFGSDFWERLVVQLSVTEPAILHATIALAAAHKRGIVSGQIRRPFPATNNPEMVMDPNERLALQHYNKAIRHLCQHLQKRDQQSLRITLASCVVFTCIELLKGDIEASQVHFQNGLRLLRELPAASKCPTDDYIIEAFTRISIRPSIFGSEFPNMHVQGMKDRSGPEIPTIFNSMEEARRTLDWLLHDINLLSAEADRYQTTNHVIQQQHLQKCTTSWLRTFTSSIPLIRQRCPKSDALIFGEPLLLLYHGMASIMVATALRGADETVFDSYTSEFASLLNGSVRLWNKVLTLVGPTHDFGFTADIGFIPPLYYLALKCRVPKFRRLAVYFVEATPHREGMWDGSLAAAVAKKVIELEEGGFYDAMGIELDQPWLEATRSLEVPADDLPLVPGEKRIRDVNVILPGKGPSVTVLYKRYTDGVWKTERVELDLRSTT